MRKKATKGTKPIIINVYADEAKNVTKVTTGGFLGTIDMTLDGNNASGIGVFRGRKYPVSVTVSSLGTVPPQKEYRGDDYVENDRIINALEGIDDERQDLLTRAEVAKLSTISTKELHKIVTDALSIEPRVWNPFLDACMQADQEFDLPEMVTVPVYAEIEGRKAIGCVITADVNGARFLFGEGEFVHCTDGLNLYKFYTDAAIDIFPSAADYYAVEE